MTNNEFSDTNMSLEAQLVAFEIPLPAGLVPAAIQASLGSERLPRRRAMRGRGALVGAVIGAGAIGLGVAAAQQLPFWNERDQGTIVEAGVPLDEASKYNAIVSDQGYDCRLTAAYGDTSRTTATFEMRATPGHEADFGMPNGITVELVSSDGTVTTTRMASGGVLGWDNRTLYADMPPVTGDSRFGAPTIVRVVAIDFYDGTLRYGNWEFEVEFVQGDVLQLPLPPGPLVAGDSTFEILSLQLSGYELTFDYLVEGPVVARYEEFFNSSSVDPARIGPMSNTISIIPRSTTGRRPGEDGLGGWGSREEKDRPYQGHITFTAPGTYRLTLGDVEQEGWLVTIP